MLISRTKPAQKTDPSLDPDDQYLKFIHWRIYSFALISIFPLLSPCCRTSDERIGLMEPIPSCSLYRRQWKPKAIVRAHILSLRIQLIRYNGKVRPGRPYLRKI